jgi:hypothetical protein
MKSALKYQQQKRRCFSATPVLSRNNLTIESVQDDESSKLKSDSSTSIINDSITHENNKSSEYAESEIDSKVNELLKEKSKKDNLKNNQRLISSANTEKSALRPKSSVSITSSSMSSESLKKYYSVSQFNKFKNKLIDRRVYNQKQYENLDQLHNDWLHKPIPQDKKYIAGKYSVEMKRINYANYIKKRQVFLSESLCIKKLDFNIE